LWSDNSAGQTLIVDGAVLGEGIFTYWVVVTNEYTCSASDTAVVKVTLWDDIDTENGWEVKLYPNPTTGEFKFVLRFKRRRVQGCYLQFYRKHCI
jgi:hypothetical protein